MVIPEEPDRYKDVESHRSPEHDLHEYLTTQAEEKQVAELKLHSSLKNIKLN